MPRPAPFRSSARSILVVTMLAASCTGSINGDNTNGGSGTKPGNMNTGSDPSKGGNTGMPRTDKDPPPPDSLCGTNIDPGPSPMRLLTRVEYGNTIKDLMGGMASIAMDFPEDGRPTHGFANDTTARSASDLLVDKFF